MRLKLQLRDECDRLLTEWIVEDGEDASEININGEIDWLRKLGPDGKRTHGELLADA